MKKIDIWLIVAVLVAVIVNPDESDMAVLLLVWGNVVAAICAKSWLLENEERKNPYDDGKDTE